MGSRARASPFAGELLVVGLALACAGEAAAPARYRLLGSGTHWDRVGSDRVLEDIQPRYPSFFDAILDPARPREPDLLPLRTDLERSPVDRRNFDALNALAIGYFELNYRAQSGRGDEHYLGRSFAAAKLLAVPWRAYGLVDDPALRDGILDFFEDAGSGGKLLTRGTAPRLVRIVASLEGKEPDPVRGARIRALAARLAAAPGSEDAEETRD